MARKIRKGQYVNPLYREKAQLFTRIKDLKQENEWLKRLDALKERARQSIIESTEIMLSVVGFHELYLSRMKLGNEQIKLMVSLKDHTHRSIIASNHQVRRTELATRRNYENEILLGSFKLDERKKTLYVQGDEKRLSPTQLIENRADRGKNLLLDRIKQLKQEKERLMGVEYARERARRLILIEEAVAQILTKKEGARKSGTIQRRAPRKRSVKAIISAEMRKRLIAETAIIDSMYVVRD